MLVNKLKLVNRGKAVVALSRVGPVQALEFEYNASLAIIFIVQWR